jgi:hypothetical protein
MDSMEQLPPVKAEAAFVFFCNCVVNMAKSSGRNKQNVLLWHKPWVLGNKREYTLPWMLNQHKLKCLEPFEHEPNSQPSPQASLSIPKIVVLSKQADQ